jgi:hypothetical protein
VAALDAPAGLSAVIGSWGTSAMASPKIARASRRGAVLKSRPSTKISPCVILTVRGSTPSSALGGRFAGAALADNPERFARREIEAHIAQSWLSVPEFRNRAQSPNREDRRHHRLSTRSSARRNPSPSWLKASTVANSTASGAANTHQV